MLAGMAHHQLLAEIAIFTKAHDMPESTFGRLSMKDWKFVRDVRAGRRLWPETEQKVRDFMVGYRPAPAIDAKQSEAA